MTRAAPRKRGSAKIPLTRGGDRRGDVKGGGGVCKEGWGGASRAWCVSRQDLIKSWWLSSEREGHRGCQGRAAAHYCGGVGRVRGGRSAGGHTCRDMGARRQLAAAHYCWEATAGDQSEQVAAPAAACWWRCLRPHGVVLAGPRRRREHRSSFNWRKRIFVWVSDPEGDSSMQIVACGTKRWTAEVCSDRRL